MDTELLIDCPVCGQAGPAEMPPCLDDHGAACPDRICSRCGTGLFIDPYLLVPMRDLSRYGAA